MAMNSGLMGYRPKAPGIKFGGALIPHPGNFTPEGQMINRQIGQMGVEQGFADQNSAGRQAVAENQLAMNNQQRGLQRPSAYMSGLSQYSAGVAGGGLPRPNPEMTSHQRAILQFAGQHSAPAYQEQGLRPLGTIPPQYDMRGHGEGNGLLTQGGSLGGSLGSQIPRYTEGNIAPSLTGNGSFIKTEYDPTTGRLKYTGGLNARGVQNTSPEYLAKKAAVDAGFQAYQSREKSGLQSARDNRLAMMASQNPAVKGLPAYQQMLERNGHGGDAPKRFAKAILQHRENKFNDTMGMIRDERLKLHKERIGGLHQDAYDHQMKMLNDLESMAMGEFRGEGVPIPEGLPGLPKTMPKQPRFRGAFGGITPTGH